MAGFGGLSFRAHKTRDENSGRNAPAYAKNGTERNKDHSHDWINLIKKPRGSEAFRRLPENQ